MRRLAFLALVPVALAGACTSFGSADDEAAGASGAPGESGGAGAGGTGGGKAGKGGSGAGAGMAAGGSGGGSAGTGGGRGGEAGDTAYEPCAGKPCGASCTQCAPNDPGCIETDEVKYCDADGECSGNYPSCGTTECGGPEDCPQPGAPCELCPDGSSACPSVDCVNGVCTGSFPTCPSVECTMDADCPASLAPCQLCPDGSTACPWSRCVQGMCSSGIDTCDGSDPCAGKACGDACSSCAGQDCPAVPAVEMYCDENLTCQLTQPLCGAECKVVEDCPMVRVCIECGDGCAAQACVDGACVFDCPDPPDDPCGGCAAGEVCIYQAGGPGPSRYTCAMEKPCASPVACACIVGQGECMFREATADDPGICVCDNGLE